MKIDSKVPCIAFGWLYSDGIALLEDTAQGQLLPEGGGASRREGCSLERANLKTEKHLLADLRSGRRGHFVLWRDRDVLTASPRWCRRQNWLLLSERSLEQSQGTSYWTSPWGEAPPLKVVLPSISTSELWFPYYWSLQTGSVKDHRTIWLETEG